MQQTIGFLQVSHPRCECHDCTQARWKMQQGSLSYRGPNDLPNTLSGQISGASQQGIGIAGTSRISNELKQG